MLPARFTQFRLFARASAAESQRLAAVLRRETVGGALLVAAAIVALVWANSPWGDTYESVRDARVGPAALHLNLSLGSWAADGLLAIFFFVAGLEVKREFVAGDLRDARRAALPIAAAVGGMVAPALVFVAINVAADNGDLAGWAIPSATDIAFALAVLAVISRHLPQLAFTVPVVRSQAAGGPHAGPGLAEHFEHGLRPLSAAFAVPVFALLASGVRVDGLANALADPVAIGVIAGLVVGKVIGIVGAAATVARFTHAELSEQLAWIDVVAVGLLAGVGFTVSLLIGELAYGSGSERDEHVKIAVLAGSLTAIALASVLLRRRDRAYRRLTTRGPPPQPVAARKRHRCGARIPTTLVRLALVGCSAFEASGGSGRAARRANTRGALLGWCSRSASRTSA